ncbi:MAG: Putative FMN hydrolase; 5-Amino-6-(5'-phosphoribitylamino)uracil phosphatase, partial [uncultured Thermomicrobiales bacterium]
EPPSPGRAGSGLAAPAVVRSRRHALRLRRRPCHAPAPGVRPRPGHPAPRPGAASGRPDRRLGGDPPPRHRSFPGPAGAVRGRRPGGRRRRRGLVPRQPVPRAGPLRGHGRGVALPPRSGSRAQDGPGHQRPGRNPAGQGRAAGDRAAGGLRLGLRGVWGLETGSGDLSRGAALGRRDRRRGRLPRRLRRARHRRRPRRRHPRRLDEPRRRALARSGSGAGRRGAGSGGVPGAATV